VTIDGPRRYGSERVVDTRCETGRPSAVLDDSVRDRVRLVFSNAEHCTQTWEAGYVKEQRWRLSDPARGVFAAGAGLIVAAPLYALSVASSRTTTSSFNDVGLESPQPVYRSVPGALTEPVLYAIIFGSLAVGMGAYEAMKATDPRPPIEGVEQTTKLLMRQLVVTGGTIHAPNLGLSGFALQSGVLELSLDEAQGLSDGELYLDGVRVELASETRERLSFLPVCKRAVDGYEAGLPLWDSVERGRVWRLAQQCDNRGWMFAEAARQSAIGGRP
jgi:hypothetical protein